MTYTASLPSAERLARQRKPRLIEQDVREPDGVTVTMLRGAGFTVERRPLLVGDYAWDIREQAYLQTHLGYSRFIVERKTLADLRDVPRLADQLARARGLVVRENAGDKTYFVVMVEYKFDSDIKRKWSDKSVRSAKLSMQNGGVRVTECGENEVYEAIDSLYTWSQKGKHELIGNGENVTTFAP